MLDDQCKQCKHLYLGDFHQWAQFCQAPANQRDPSPNQRRNKELPGQGRLPWCHDVVVPNCPEFVQIERPKPMDIRKEIDALNREIEQESRAEALHRVAGVTRRVRVGSPTVARRDALVEVADALDTLQAVVDELDRTADGVPITPKTKLYQIDPSGMMGKGKPWLCGPGWKWQRVDRFALYSTPEAAVASVRRASE